MMNTLYSLDTGTPQPQLVTLTPDQLTTRQHEMAVLVAQGYSNKEIAMVLHIHVQTVKNTLGMLYARLGLQGYGNTNRVTLAVWAVKQGLG
jgi:DNA-binding CsgD family transcriptional regulator